ncbi:MAG: amidohydrolase family protein [Rhodobacteraceae bacterium]|nr:amidohydrolase family protein [Paracoccaceae bacterium]
MAAAQYVDADTHIVEDADIWSLLGNDEIELKPRIVVTEPDKAAPGVFPTGQYWMIDGELYGKGGQALINYSDGTRTFQNSAGRVADMDKYGIASQVIYTSIFLGLAPKSPRTELALARAYNRKMAEICSKYKDRFHYVAVPSAMNVRETVADMNEWKKNGACGLMLRGYENDKMLNHKHFWPIYAAAESLDMPICIHIGSGSRNLRNIEGGGGNAINVAMPNLLAFGSIINSHIPSEFPKLRFGLIESGSEWLPFAVSRAKRYEARYKVPNHFEKMLADKRLFVTCEQHEDLPEIIKLVGEDCLMLGTDYGHSDTSTELKAHEMLMARNDISRAVADKINVANPKALYGI